MDASNNKTVMDLRIHYSENIVPPEARGLIDFLVRFKGIIFSLDSGNCDYVRTLACLPNLSTLMVN